MAGERPPGTKPDEGSATSAGVRSRLVECAVREFGSKGLDGAGTRSIAAAAGTIVSAITYHFGGKRGLQLAAADHIAGRMAEWMEPAIAAERTVPTDDSAAAKAAASRLMTRFFDEIARDGTADWSLFLMREQLTPGVEAERIWEGAMGLFLTRVTELVRHATGTSVRDAAITTMTLVGQAQAVRGSRAALLRLCGLDALDAATLAAFRARIVANVDAILATQHDSAMAVPRR